MTFKEKLSSGAKILTTEIGPPKGTSLDKVLSEIEPLRNRVDAVNATDMQSSVMRMSSFAACVLLKQHGFEPVLQVTCRDRNRLALQSDILSAAALNIRNILVLTGDHPALGDHPEAKPVFDLDSVQLLDVLRRFATGEDMNANKLSGPVPEFCAGAVVNPGADPLEPEIIKMEKKLEAGAEFFQTQAVYDIKVFERFLDASKHLKTNILAGIVLLKSERMAQYMNDNVPGVFVPDGIIDEMRQAQNKKAKCVEIASRLITELRPMCRGVHIMPIGWYDVMPAVLDAI